MAKQKRLTQHDLKTVAHMMSKKGIDVRVGGTKCATDGNRIYIPSLPEGYDNQKVLGLIRYYLDHECGHIVGESNFDLMKERVKSHGDVGNAFYLVADAIEDIRCDAVMSERWRGCDENLRAGVDHILDSVESGNQELPDNPFQQAAIASYAAGKGRKVAGIMPEVQQVVDSFEDEIKRASTKDSTDKVLPVADALFNELKQRFPQEAQQLGGAGDEEGEGDGDGSGDGQAGQGGGSGRGGDGSGKPQSGGGKQDSSGGQGNGDGGTGDAGGDGGEEGEDQGDGSSGGGSDDDAESGDGSENESESGTKGAGGHGGSDKLLPESPIKQLANKEISNGVDEAYYQQVHATPPIAPDWAMRPFSIDLYEKGEDGRVREPTDTSKGFDDSVNRAAGVIGAQLRQMLQSESKRYWRGGKQSGMPDPRSIAALAAKTSTNVMAKRVDAKAKDTACYLLCDASGSMRGDELETAMMAAAAFAKVVNLAGHKAKVVTYDGASISHLPRSMQLKIRDEIIDRNGGVAAAIELAKEYARKEWPNEPQYEVMFESIITGDDAQDLNYFCSDAYGLSTAIDRSVGHNGVARMIEVQGWDQKYRQRITAYRRAARLYGGGTPTGEAIFEAVRDLGSRRESRKILMVFTDGDPNDLNLAKKAVREAERKGIEVVLIGIGTCGGAADRIKRGAPVVYNINELGSATMASLRKCLGM